MYTYDPSALKWTQKEIPGVLGPDSVDIFWDLSLVKDTGSWNIVELIKDLYIGLWLPHVHVWGHTSTTNM